jgi:outer membrane protein TolC
MNKVVRASLGIFLMTLLSQSFGSDALSVHDILKIANEKNLQIQIAQGKLQIAQAQTKQAWSTVSPKITAAAGLNRVDSYQNRSVMSAFSSLGTVLANVPSANLAPLTAMSGASSATDYYSTKLSVSQVLFNGSVFPAITASNYGLKSAESGLRMAKEEVYSNLLNMAFSEIQLQRNLDVLRESRKQMELLMTKVSALQRNGLATQIDVLRTSSSLSRLDVSIINVRNSIANLYQNMDMVLNQDIGTPTINSDIIESLVNDFSIPVDFDSKSLLANRSDYQQLLAMQNLMETNVSIQQGNYLPSLVLAGSYGYMGTSGFNLNDANRDWTIGVNGSWNLFDFGSIDSKVEEAKANEANMKRQIEQTLKTMGNDLRSTQLNASSAKEKIASIKDEVKMNEDAFRLMSSRYALGEVTSLELIDAHNQLLASRKNMVEAKIEYSTQVIKWLKSTGQLVQYFEK